MCRQLLVRLDSRDKNTKVGIALSTSLQALTAAALSLPGLIPSPVSAADEEAGLQYGYYQEGNRNLYGVVSRFKPIEVNSLHGTSKFSLTDRVKMAINFTQDIWSGATPIATAPLSFGGNKAGGIISGATPYLQNNAVFFDKQLNPLTLNTATGQFTKDTQLVHTLSAASPEVRKQADFRLGYEWDEAALDVGGGLSGENDYDSRFGSLSGRWDFNQKLTSLNLNLNYTNSHTHATLDHDATPYFWETSSGFLYKNTASNNYEIKKEQGNNILYGNRQDWATGLGVTQILGKNSLLKADLGFTRSNGYMANPYKAVEVAFVDPNQTGNVLSGVAIGLLEKRPDMRSEWTGSMRYVQYVEPLNAALHFDYHFFHDDWGINAHTFEADWNQPLGAGWSVTPRVRYYSQNAANFYYPYLVSNQALSTNVVDANGNKVWVNPGNPNGPQYTINSNGVFVDAQGHVVSGNNLIPKKTPFDASKLPANYSSDQRLSGFGALSGGITISKQFAKGVFLEAGAEYYTHAGSLKLGGGGEGSYADFNYYMVNGTLRVDLSALSLATTGHDEHKQHKAHQHGNHAPAGVMFDHVLDNAGEFMVGTRYMYGTQSGTLQQGLNPVSDQQIVNHGCNVNPCYVTPTGMNMNMIMVDLMYAPTDWLTLMLMPQFVDMNMNMRTLDGAPAATNDQQSLIEHHTLHQHTTGGIGDTGMYALFKLLENSGQRLVGTLGISAPTGKVDLTLRDTHRIQAGFQHYGMQLGSGTWDFKPNFTYTGQMGKYGWGAQFNGTVRLQDQNQSGFAFGDIFQSTAWGSYSLLNWLSASVRGIYTLQGTIRGGYNGAFTKLGSMDYPNNYGGSYWDVGFGLNAFVPKGDLRGNNLSFEWLQPVSDNVNGYQLPRTGALSATWSYMF